MGVPPHGLTLNLEPIDPNHDHKTFFYDTRHPCLDPGRASFHTDGRVCESGLLLGDRRADVCTRPRGALLPAAHREERVAPAFFWEGQTAPSYARHLWRDGHPALFLLPQGADTGRRGDPCPARRVLHVHPFADLPKDHADWAGACLALHHCCRCGGGAEDLGLLLL